MPRAAARSGARPIIGGTTASVEAAALLVEVDSRVSRVAPVGGRSPGLACLSHLLTDIAMPPEGGSACGGDVLCTIGSGGVDTASMTMVRRFGADLASDTIAAEAGPMRRQHRLPGWFHGKTW